MRFHCRRFVLCAAIDVLLLAPVAHPQETVIFTRHAEKSLTPPTDPSLTEAGQRRAELLAAMLADSGVEAIYVTELRRTQQTAAPLAERVHIKPTIVPAKDVNQLVNDIRSRKKGVVVVVGHSNTLPKIIAALGGPSLEIPDDRYDNLFILTLEPTRSALLRIHYGDAMPVATPAGSMIK